MADERKPCELTDEDIDYIWRYNMAPDTSTALRVLATAATRKALEWAARECEYPEMSGWDCAEDIGKGMPDA